MHKDVIIVGAGISGIAAGYNMKNPVQINPFQFLREEKVLVVHGIFLNILA